jgi:hypothetical protein
VKWIIGGCAALALATASFVYSAINSILDEDWEFDWEVSDRE